MWRSNIALEDFLLFSERVYGRMFELHNLALWPLHIVTLAIGLFLIVAVAYPRPRLIRMALALLGGLWIFVAIAFVYGRYAQINWAVVYLLPLFGAVAAVLVYFALRPRRPLIEHTIGISKVVAISVLLFAVLGYPMLAVVDGRSIRQAEVFGIAPDPTAVATLAFLAVLRGPGGISAMVVVSLWAAVTALTLHTLGRWDFFVVPLAAVICIGIWVLGSRRTSPTTG